MTEDELHFYVFDTGPFIKLRAYPHDIFPKLWLLVEELVADGRVESVSEVFKELTVSDGDMTDWAKTQKAMFHKPSEDEQLQVQAILAKFPQLIKPKNILTGKPEADPFVIARAIVQQRVVVTTERLKPNAQKIPNACEEFGVEYIGLFDFFRREGWRF